MAIRIGNVVKRDLQEQVEKNKQDIAKHYEIDRVLSDWGIKVLGVVNTPSDIPEGIYEYGDAYGVRTGSGIVYYVWTRANINVGQDEDYWLDIGALSLVGPTGPQGLQGPQGIQGVRGSLWVSSTTAPTSQIGNNGDQWLDTTTGDVYQKGTSTWTRTGNIKGPQGVQGPVGPKGDQGIQGPTGSQGPKGDTGSSFKIGGLLNSIDNLPTPTEANRSVGYAVARQDNTYDLYVVVGTDNLQWVNMGRVEGVEGPQGPVGPQGPAGADIQIVSITGIPSTATSGTLTQEQVQTLLAHPGNYIQFFNENFYPQDVEIEQGYIVYSHVGQIGNETKIKNINLTIATGSWVLTENSLETKQETIDFSTWLSNQTSNGFTGSVPQEYRDIERLKKALLSCTIGEHKYIFRFIDIFQDTEYTFLFIKNNTLENLATVDITINIETWAIRLDGYTYQPKLESGVNIKTINNQSILGSGNITIEGGGSGGGAKVLEIDLSFLEAPTTEYENFAAQYLSQSILCQLIAYDINYFAFFSDAVNGGTYSIPVSQTPFTEEEIVNIETGYYDVIKFTNLPSGVLTIYTLVSFIKRNCPIQNTNITGNVARYMISCSGIFNNSLSTATPNLTSVKIFCGLFVDTNADTNEKVLTVEIQKESYELATKQ